jgi:pimeloyl-ACP methyl ester carboxylesterase
VELYGDLALPERPGGLVLFAHGSGSSRYSPRNRFLAAALERRGLATLLLDLLTPDEETLDARTSEYRFDIARLARRLVGVVDWLRNDARTALLPIGLFGASTGAAAALRAAAERPCEIDAVVSRGGRPDLAGPALAQVATPTLLIVGSLDAPVIALNQEALTKMRTTAALIIVKNASHLFSESGALESVADLAGDWFDSELGRPATGRLLHHFHATRGSANWR